MTDTLPPINVLPEFMRAAETRREVSVNVVPTMVVDSAEIIPHRQVEPWLPAPMSEARGHLLKADDQWEWQDLRDYVVAQIEHFHGPFPRDAAKEAGIFKRFITTHGPADSARIARYAFETCQGRWAGAPISVRRFCKGSDKFFAAPILERMTA